MPIANLLGFDIKMKSDFSGLVVNVLGTATAVNPNTAPPPPTGLIIPQTTTSIQTAPPAPAPAPSSATSSSRATSSNSSNNGGVCVHCNKTFKQLRSHIQDVHCPTPTPCPLCGKIFSSKHKMFGHKYRSCPNRTRNLVRHLQDLDQGPTANAAPATQQPTNNGETSQQF